MRKRMVTKCMAFAVVAMVGTGMMTPVTAHAEDMADAPIRAEYDTIDSQGNPVHVIDMTTDPSAAQQRVDGPAMTYEECYEVIRQRMAAEEAAKQAANSAPTETSSPAPEQAPASVSEQASAPAPAPSVVENITTEELKVESPKKSVASSDDKVKAEVKTENEVKDDKTETNVKSESESEKKAEKAVSAARRANDKIKANAETLTKVVEEEPTGMEAIAVTLKTTVGNGVAAVQTFFCNVVDGIQGLFEGFVSLF